MKITTILSDLILEQGRFNFLYNQNVGNEKEPIKLSFETLKNIIFADPTTRYPEGFDVENATKKDMENNVKVGEYTNWLLNKFNTKKPSDLGLENDIDRDSREYKNTLEEYKRRFIEDLPRFNRYLEYYDKVKKLKTFTYDRNIDKLTLDDLQTIFIQFRPKNEKDKEEDKEFKKMRMGFNHPGGKIVFEGNDWTIIKITDKGKVGKDAAIWYGGFHEERRGESSWCTSWPKNVAANRFDIYINQAPLYIIFPNNDKGEVGEITGLPKERYQFHFYGSPSQFMNRLNSQISLKDMFNGPMKEIKEFFKSEFRNLVNLSNTNKFSNIFEFDVSDNKWLEIYLNIYNEYGTLNNFIIESLENLNNDVEIIKIKNKGNLPVYIDLPDKIGEFTELTQLSLKNVIKTLPDTICNLKKLQILDLEDNKKLNKLPECLVNIVEKPDMSGGSLAAITIDGTNINFSETGLEDYFEKFKKTWILK